MQGYQENLFENWILFALRTEVVKGSVPPNNCLYDNQFKANEQKAMTFIGIYIGLVEVQLSMHEFLFIYVYQNECTICCILRPMLKIDLDIQSTYKHFL